MDNLESLNLIPRKGETEADVNPCTRPDIKLHGEIVPLGDPLTADELEIFKAQFATLLAGPGSEERRIQLDRIGAYVMGFRALKHQEAAAWGYPRIFEYIRQCSNFGGGR